MTDERPAWTKPENWRTPNVEQAVLGSLLLDVHSARKAFGILTADMFQDIRHQVIFRAIRGVCDTCEGNADIVLVADILAKEGILDDVGGEHYLIELIDEVPNASNAVYYARLVAEKAAERKKA
jgi:replicative DNA helicase